MKCNYIKKNGLNCQANAMINNKYCYLHNPDITKREKQDAQSRGGKTKIIKVNEPMKKVIRTNNSKDITKLLSKMINDVLQDRLDLRIATGITYIANVLLKAFELSELEKRIDNIEQHLTNKKYD